MKYANTANSLQRLGRYGDSMLVHMSPQEVSGLQSLARRHGTTMTVNPDTGLPEAFSLKNILPIAAGAALSPFVGPLGAGMITGGLGALMTGDLGQGLMMGLGAAGGAGLAGSVANLAAPAAAAGSAGAGAAGAASAAANPFTSGMMASGAGGAMPSLGSAAASAIPTPAIDAVAGNVLPTAAESLGMPQATTVAGNLSPGIQLPQNTLGNVADLADYTSPALPNNTFSSIAPEGVYQQGIFPNAQPAMTQTSSLPTYDRMREGFSNLVENPSLAKDLFNDNKMQFAMAAAPMLMPEQTEYESPFAPQMIRPFTLGVENLSALGSEYKPGSTSEREMLKYKYTAGKPYKAAAGGLMAYRYDEGGNVSASTDADPISDTGAMPVSPFDASMNRIAANKTYQNIADVQRLAGLNSYLQNINFAPRAQIQRPDIPVPTITRPQFVDYGVKLPEGTTTIKDKTSTSIPTWMYPNYQQNAFANLFYYNQGGRNNANSGLGYASGGIAGSRMLRGPGDGVSDSIPAIIGQRQPARLADGEFVVDARTVSELGNGSSDAGAKKLEAMVNRVHGDRKRAKRGKDSKAERHLPV